MLCLPSTEKCKKVTSRFRKILYIIILLPSVIMPKYLVPAGDKPSFKNFSHRFGAAGFRNNKANEGIPGEGPRLNSPARPAMRAGSIQYFTFRWTPGILRRCASCESPCQSNKGIYNYIKKRKRTQHQLQSHRLRKENQTQTCQKQTLRSKLERKASQTHKTFWLACS